MARHFSQAKIDEYKECFSFNAKRNYISQDDELSLIMRSLGFSPTREEVVRYLEKNKDDGKMNFASFLDVLHEHSQLEDVKTEILQAFKTHDIDKKGYVSAKELRHILTNIGDRLTDQEVNSLLREFRISPDGPVHYEAFLKQLLTPFPDYDLS
ncbi:4 [Octopus vulgaris]|uniref:4 n=1 Tax=Octopus vulgaris TaxID=6645 RepID=A0AA36F7V6_OCTVU|nr:4 [Octopus vulgaris] [Octopus vulgaris]